MRRWLLVLGLLLLPALSWADIQLKSGATTDTLTVDPTSKAARITEYDSDGVKFLNKQSYSASTATFTPAATTTDFCRITGSATKTIRVWSITLSGTQTTAGNVSQYVLIKRSTANTAGTFVSATVVPHDSNNAAATVTVGHYTANPTVGSTVGTVRGHRTLVPAPATAVFPAYVGRWEFGQPDNVNHQVQPIVLRGTTQELNVNGSGAAIPTGAATYQCDFVWTEE